MSLKQVFENGEADEWYARNLPKLKGEDKAFLPVLRQLGAQPGRVLEIGCSDGWRLAQVCDAFGATGAGVDLSAKAVASGRELRPALDLRVADAATLPFADNSFDLVMFGFCLYACDPAAWFQIAAQADRVLASGGWLMILDFNSPFPYRNPYARAQDAFTHKMSWDRMFAWHPHYSLIHRQFIAYSADPHTIDNRVVVDVLRKAPPEAFPTSPYRS